MIGFLRRLKTGQPLTIIYRSKPYVTVNPSPAQASSYQAADAGTPAAIKRSVALVKKMNQGRKPILDPQKSFKQLYDETIGEKYGIS